MEDNNLQPENPQPSLNKNSGITSEAYDWAESIVFALAIVVTIFTFLIRPVGVIGTSMLNTLHNGDKVVICNINYTPKQGDIVVLSTEAVTTPIIKRVIAVGGQTVKIDYEKNKVYVDNKEYDAPIREKMLPEGDATYPLKVKPGYVFVMGDNRNDSLDSRFNQIGQVNVKNIIGHAVFRIMPFNTFGRLN